MSSKPDQFSTGYVINGRYRIVGRIGEGAAGNVFRVEDIIKPGSRPALKLQYLPATFEPGGLGFEFRVLSRLSHPNLAGIYDFGLVRREGPGGPLCFFTREYVEGENLGEALAGAGSEKIRAAAAALCRALRYIHSRKVIHQDIKPENIICPEEDEEDKVERLKLIDFGLARAPGKRRRGIGGSLLYIAPEVLEGGSPDERSDLYSLGVALYHAIGGVPPFQGDDLPGLLEGMKRKPRSLSSLRSDVAEDICGAVMRLMEKDPADRYGSASSVLHDLTGEEDAAEAVVLPGSAFVGFDEPMEKLQRLLDTRQRSGGGVAASIIGETGSGKSRLLEELKWKAQLAGYAVVEGSFSARFGPEQDLFRSVLAQLGSLAGSPVEEVIRSLSVPPGHLSAADPGAAAACGLAGEGRDEFLRAKEIISGSIISLSGDRTVIILEDLHAADSESTEILLYLMRRIQEGGKGPFLIVSLQPCRHLVEATAAIEGVGRVDLGELGEEEVSRIVESLLGRPSPGLAAAIFRHVGGNPLLVEETVRNLAERGALPPDELVDDVRLRLPSNLSKAVLERLALLDDRLRDIILFGAVFDRPWGWEDILLFARDVAPEEMAGGDFEREMESLADRKLLTRVDSDRFDFVSTSIKDILYDHCDAGKRSELHGKIADVLEEKGKREEQLVFAAHHVLRSEPRERKKREKAADLAARAAGELMSLHAYSRAGHLLRRGIDMAPSRRAKTEMSLLLGESYCLSGKYDEAVSLFDGLVNQASGGELKGVLLGRMGSVLEMKGSYMKAESSLDDAIAEGLPRERLPSALDTLAKVKMMTGQYEAARGIIAGGLEEQVDDSIRSSLQRTLSLVACYEGRFEEAHEKIDAARKLSRDSGDLRGEAVAENCAAIIFQRQGELAAALDHYRESHRLYEGSGYIGGLPVVLLNIGTIYYQLGNFTGALDKFESSIRVARRLEKVSTVAASMINIGNIYIYFGEMAEARRYVSGAVDLARKHAMKTFEAKGHLCLGEIALAEGKLSEAADSCLRALEIFRELGNKTDIVEAALEKGEIDLADGRFTSALAAAEEVIAMAGQLSHGRYEAAGLTLRGKSLGRIAGRERDALVSLRRALEMAAGGRHSEEEWKAHRALWLFYRERGEHEPAERHRGSALEILTNLAYSLPEPYRVSFWQNSPDRRSCKDEGGAPGRQPGGMAGGEREKMFRLLEINRKILSEKDARRLLELAMDTAVELFMAERGFLILKDEKGKMNIAVARNIDRETVRGARLKISRSIAEKVAMTGEPLLTMSARDDERFTATRSVHELKLKSVMCVPIRGREKILGTLYIDNRFQMDLFTDEDLRLMLSFADVIAVALENIRMQEENRRRRIDLEKAKAELDGMYRKQADRLNLALRDLEAKQNILEFKYDYSRIVGRSPAMLHVLGLIERVTESDVSVLIEGESGTGKELVARTIHFNGPRCKDHFVSLNCGAVPETLLESELFGYRRGAFTGADEDREGLLSLAHKGSIFLDEIGEMTHAMQVKMLRFLQSGEIRQLGAGRDTRVDVRVIAATNRSLEGMVGEGRFREDLFYRINVVMIVMPPLRERREDIPVLCEHFLESLSSEMKIAKRTFTGKAMDILLQYDWPGNIRELENVIKNALILGDSSRITPADLHLKADKKKDLRQSVDKLEMVAIEEKNIRKVLEVAGGNKAEAARLLGIGRMTLYRKIKKYNIES